MVFGAEDRAQLGRTPGESVAEGGRRGAAFVGRGSRVEGTGGYGFASSSSAAVEIFVVGSTAASTGTSSRGHCHDVM